MGNYQITYKLDSAISIDETLTINDVRIYLNDGDLYADIEVTAMDIDEAKGLAYTTITNVCSSLSFITGQIINFHFDKIKDLNVEPPLFRSLTEVFSTVTITKPITDKDTNDALEVLKLMEQYRDLELIMLLVNRPDYLTWVTLYKIYEIIDHDVNIKKRGWLTKRERNSFRRSANHPKASNVFDSRHGVQTQEPPEKPMSLNEAEKIINKLIVHWMEKLEHHLKRES